VAGAVVAPPSGQLPLLPGRRGAAALSANALAPIAGAAARTRASFSRPSLDRSGRRRRAIAGFVEVAAKAEASGRLNAKKSPSNSASDEEEAAAAAPSTTTPGPPQRRRRARDLVVSLVRDARCLDTPEGARLLGEACDPGVVWDDRFLPQPIAGREAVVDHLARTSRRHGNRRIRVDRVSDGDAACGYCWTWTSGGLEGLRGTTFVQLDNITGKIAFVQEIPEPIFKPGDLTKDLLRALTRGAEPRRPRPFAPRTPAEASEVARYLYVDLQSADDKSSIQELLRLLDPGIKYRDFNYEEMMVGPEQVERFVRDFTFPGIEFRPTRFDDGVDSTCFTWEVVLEGVADADQTIKGISFYELDPATRKISYVRDVPESAIKPPLLGSLARLLRPGLGVFAPVPIGSRPGGM
jgi:hypothetical protein